MSEIAPLEIITIREYMDATRTVLLQTIEQRFVAQEKLDAAYNTAFSSRIDYMNATREQRFQALEKTIDSSHQALDHRLELMNQFRAQLNAQATLFINRTEVEEKIHNVVTMLDRSDQRMQRIEQIKANESSHEGLEKRVQTLEQLTANFEGRMWSIGVGAGLFSIVTAVLLHFVR